MAYGRIYMVCIWYHVLGTTRAGVNIWRYGEGRGLRVKAYFLTLYTIDPIYLYILNLHFPQNETQISKSAIYVKNSKNQISPLTKIFGVDKIYMYIIKHDTI